MKDNDREKDNKDLIPFLGVKRKWAALALHIFVQIVFVYSLFIIYEYGSSGWQGLETVKAIVKDLDPFIGIAAFITIFIFAEVELLMILYNIVKEQIEARQKRRLEKAEEKGRAEGFQQATQEWSDWFKRKDAAEAAGEPFDEPSPAEKHHAEDP